MVAGAIETGKAIVVCDGSFTDKFGTVAYFIEVESRDSRLVAVDVAPD
jgi:hypothetical protein